MELPFKLMYQQSELLNSEKQSTENEVSTCVDENQKEVEVNLIKTEIEPEAPNIPVLAEDQLSHHSDELRQVAETEEDPVSNISESRTLIQVQQIPIDSPPTDSCCPLIDIDTEPDLPQDQSEEKSGLPSKTDRCEVSEVVTQPILEPQVEKHNAQAQAQNYTQEENIREREEQPLVEGSEKNEAPPAILEPELVSKTQGADDPPPKEEPNPQEVKEQTNQQEPVVQQPTSNDSKRGHDILISQRSSQMKKEQPQADKGESLFKGVAIKLKKELVKTKNELEKLKESSQNEEASLKAQIKELKEIEQTNFIKIASLEAQVCSLEQQLNSSEEEYSILRSEFEQYKKKASELISQNNPAKNSDDKFKFREESEYKRLKEANSLQEELIADLEKKLGALREELRARDQRLEKLMVVAESTRIKDSKIQDLIDKRDSILRENQNLKLTLKEYKAKLNEPDLMVRSDRSLMTYRKENKNDLITTLDKNLEDDIDDDEFVYGDRTKVVKDRNINNKIIGDINEGKEREPQRQLSNRAQDQPVHLSSSSQSSKGESQSNSSSSIDDSTLSGYVHIKPPNTFEMINRSSVLEDGQNQIDNLTKAYLESENTNALLHEQVKTLKEEIRRMQLRAERIELAENLEYLKNVIFKYLSLDSYQSEQKKRLIPVLSTVLKLSPDETAKLTSIAITDKPTMASSIFKL